MYNRILKIPLDAPHSVFLFGPRGTGKTSWLKATLPDATYIDLLEFNLYKELSADPSRLQKYIPNRFTGWIIIDEIQKIPELLNEVHRLIENNSYRFLLAGSSARSLKRKGVNLLAGRALQYYMHPLTIQELHDDFDLLHALQYGLLPASMKHIDPEKYLSSYTETYLHEEVIQQGLTRNIGAFNRFLEIASFSQGSQINTSAMAREIGIDRQMVSNYFIILEDLLLAKRLAPFTKRAKRRLTSHEKFYFFDVGVFRNLRPMGLLDTPAEAEGAALETLFLQSLLAINDYYNLGYEIYFWRTNHGTEVDFIAYGPKGLHAFEIKRNQVLHGKNFTGLKAFKKDYDMAKLYLVYTGKQSQYYGDIQVLPIVTILQQLPNILG